MSQVVVVDHDPEIVKSLAEEKIEAVYGTPESEGLWDRIDLKQAKLLVVSIPNIKNSLEMILANHRI